MFYVFKISCIHKETKYLFHTSPFPNCIQIFIPSRTINLKLPEVWLLVDVELEDDEATGLETELEGDIEALDEAGVTLGRAP